MEHENRASRRFSFLLHDTQLYESMRRFVGCDTVYVPCCVFPMKCFITLCQNQIYH